jgi:hypothetical protein
LNPTGRGDRGGGGGEGDGRADFDSVKGSVNEMIVATIVAKENVLTISTTATVIPLMTPI